MKHSNLKDYFYFGILIYSGCRVGGLVALKYKDLNFEQGYFYTQEKATKKSSGWNRYFLPLNFCKELKVWCLQNNIKNDDKFKDMLRSLEFREFFC